MFTRKKPEETVPIVIVEALVELICQRDAKLQAAAKALDHIRAHFPGAAEEFEVVMERNQPKIGPDGRMVSEAATPRKAVDDE